MRRSAWLTGQHGNSVLKYIVAAPSVWAMMMAKTTTTKTTAEVGRRGRAVVVAASLGG
eukprot:COSAG05_NODE_75_length_21588_cov_303.091438_13_plen_58_part_00